MASTLTALDLGAEPVRIRDFLYRPREVVVKRWPPAPGIKLRFGGVEGVVAPATNVIPGLVKIVVLSAKWSLRPLVLDDAFLFVP